MTLNYDIKPARQYTTHGWSYTSNLGEVLQHLSRANRYILRDVVSMARGIQPTAHWRTFAFHGFVGDDGVMHPEVKNYVLSNVQGEWPKLTMSSTIG